MIVDLSQKNLRSSPMLDTWENDVRIWSIFISIFVWLMAILKLSVIVRSSVFDGLCAWYGRCTIRRFRLISFDFVELDSDGFGRLDFATFVLALMNSAARLEFLCPISRRCWISSLT